MGVNVTAGSQSVFHCCLQVIFLLSALSSQTTARPICHPLPTGVFWNDALHSVLCSSSIVTLTPDKYALKKGMLTKCPLFEKEFCSTLPLFWLEFNCYIWDDFFFFFWTTPEVSFSQTTHTTDICFPGDWAPLWYLRAVLETQSTANDRGHYFAQMFHVTIDQSSFHSFILIAALTVCCMI